MPSLPLSARSLPSNMLVLAAALATQACASTRACPRTACQAGSLPPLGPLCLLPVSLPWQQHISELCHLQNISLPACPHQFLEHPLEFHPALLLPFKSSEWCPLHHYPMLAAPACADNVCCALPVPLLGRRQPIVPILIQSIVLMSFL